MDDLSPGARSLLQAAETYDDPSQDDATRVRRAVLSRVGAVGITATVVAASSTQAKAASVMSLAAKLTAALAVTAGGVAASWSYVSHEPAPVAVTTPAPAHVKAAKPVAVTAPSQQALVVDELKVEEEVAPVRRAQPRPARVEPEKVEPARPEPTPADLEAEMKLIRGADSALRAGRSGEALSLLAQHRAEHPRASLAHEREGLRAIAQCQLGAAGSTATAERFIERAPRSPLAPRLRNKKPAAASRLLVRPERASYWRWISTSSTAASTRLAPPLSLVEITTRTV